MNHIRNITFVTSLILLGVGLWWIYPPTALVGLGLLLLGLTIHGWVKDAK